MCYEELVYAGVLGKVVGVYMGRPFESWPKDKVVARWGLVDHYVEDERKIPLVVPDDDITGTFTFVRALEDSGRYADATPQDFANAWLNYIVAHRTNIWWGGMGRSTCHTAYMRLKAGIPAPQSGSIELNGDVIAQQIGAQICIDSIGMVCPGDPVLAARLARTAASVAYDGEAIHGAQVVAAMVAAAFTEKDVERLLDIGVSMIPADSLIARVHRDVRTWCREDRDWHRTYDRIAGTYGYQQFGGACHMVPNHALMVMAWAYAEGSFRRAQAIVNTAGWDTDCNAGNVGSVMGLAVGLEGIGREYDFLAPVADRLMLPTAEGTRNASDCLAEALHLARIGRRVMGWPAQPAPKGGAAFHFSLPQSCQGFQVERGECGASSTARTRNVSGPDGTRMLAVDYREACNLHPIRVSTPTLYEPVGGVYGVMGSARVVSGQTVNLQAVMPSGGVHVRLFLRHYEAATRKPTGMFYSEPATAAAGAPITLVATAPDTQGWPIVSLGVEIAGPPGSAGRLLIDRVSISGAPCIHLPAELPRNELGVIGWVTSSETWWPGLCMDRDRGVAVTGNCDWTDYTVAGTVLIPCADAAGLVARYQGLQRYLMLAKTRSALRLVSRYDGIETVLAECPCVWSANEKHRLELKVTGSHVVGRCDGADVLGAVETRLTCGGAGYAVEAGHLRFEATRITG